MSEQDGMLDELVAEKASTEIIFQAVEKCSKISQKVDQQNSNKTEGNRRPNLCPWIIIFRIAPRDHIFHRFQEYS